MQIASQRLLIIIAFAIFLFIGIIRGWISLWMLAAAGVLGIVGMFWLATAIWRWCFPLLERPLLDRI